MKMEKAYMIMEFSLNTYILKSISVRNRLLKILWKEQKQTKKYFS